MRKRDAIVLVMLVAFVILTAGAVAHTKMLMCTTNLKKLGEARPMYCDSYGGRMPPPAGEPTNGQSNIRAPYEVRQDPLQNGKPVWMNLGCLVGAGLITSGKELYCPANGMAEYESFCTSVDAGGNKISAPWGTIPNWPTRLSAWWHVEVRNGYAFWPMSRHLLTQAEYNNIDTAVVRYMIGLPATPARFADMDPGKTFAADYSVHTIKGYGFNVQAVFGDGHVGMVPVPVDDGSVTPANKGKYWYPYQGSIPSGESRTNWLEIVTVKYFNALQ